MNYIDENEYAKLWEEIKNEWELDDFLNHPELYKVLENDHLYKYYDTISNSIEEVTEKFYELNENEGFLDNKSSDFNSQIVNTVYMFMNKEYDEDLIKNNEELMFKLLD